MNALFADEQWKGGVFVLQIGIIYFCETRRKHASIQRWCLVDSLLYSLRELLYICFIPHYCFLFFALLRDCTLEDGRFEYNRFPSIKRRVQVRGNSERIMKNSGFFLWNMKILYHLNLNLKLKEKFLYEFCFSLFLNDSILRWYL